MNGPLAKALLNLLASYIDKNGAALFEKLLAIILQKLNPTVVTEFASGEVSSEEVEFSAACDELIANPPTE